MSESMTSTYSAAAWQLTSGEVIVKIGCQTRSLKDWDENASLLVDENLGSTPSQPGKRVSNMALLLSFLIPDTLAKDIEATARRCRMRTGMLFIGRQSRDRS